LIPSLPKTAVAAFLLALVIAALLTPNLRRFAEARGLLDQPNDSRRVHRRAVPRIGGVAIVAAFYGPLLGLLFYETGLGNYFYASGTGGIALLLGGAAIAALGFYDDLRGANAWQKFAVQFAVAGGLYACGYRIEQVSLPGGALQLGVLALPLTVFWIVGIINAMNLIDGLDGLAGGVALCAVLTNLVVAMVRGEPIMTLCMGALAGALIGFLFYNFNPASIFLGDTGSLFLGYVLAVTSIRTHQKSSAVVSLLVPIVALAVPIVDTALAMGRRALSGRPMFSGDRDHIHHRLLGLGLSQRQAALVLYAASVVLGGLALLLSFANDPAVAWILVALSVAAFVALRQLGFFRADGQAWQLRRRNRALRSALDDMARSLRRASSVGDVLDSAKGFVSVVSADRMRVDLRSAEMELHESVRSAVLSGPSSLPVNGHANGVPAPFLARFNLPDALGRVELEWHDGRTELDRDHELAAEVLCGHIGNALRRVAPGVEHPRRAISPILAPFEPVVSSLALARDRRRHDPDA
jgi:UDP-GlcNAc:undecaprenyl-phosphate GlcNAc-1-phosphate transferase